MKSELAKVGPAWEGGNIERWPGVAGVAGETNHLAHNINPFLPDPVDSSSTRDINMSGGKKMHKKSKKMHKKSKKMHKKSVKKMKMHKKSVKKMKMHKKSKKMHKKSGKKSKKMMRGGSKHGNTLLPQSLVNLGRSVEYGVKGFWSDFTGDQAPVNPDPTVQPISK